MEMRSEMFELEAQRLLLQGYAPHAPSEGAREIDSGVANTSTCEECGFHGHYYKPFYNAEEHIYLAFAVCGGCGNVIEF
jgi:hypothetical protein